MIFYYTEDKFILTFMLICYIFIFSQEIFFFFFALHGMRLLVPQPGTEHELPAVEAWSFNH